MLRNVKELALAEKDYILDQRHYLHAHPELGREERNTTNYLAQELEQMGIAVKPFRILLAALVLLTGLKGPGKTLMLRADIDALPIAEDPAGKFYASQNPGVMHACGHDCHMAMLLGPLKNPQPAPGRFFRYR